MALLLDFVRACKTGQRELQVPRYDKSQHNGRGDRVPRSEWVTKQGERATVSPAWFSTDRVRFILLLVSVGPLDVLLVEGWCMGFEAIDDAAVSEYVSSRHDVMILELMTLTSHVMPLATTSGQSTRRYGRSTNSTSSWTRSS